MSWDPGAGELKSRIWEEELTHTSNSAWHGSDPCTMQIATRDKRQAEQCPGMTMAKRAHSEKGPSTLSERR